MTDREPQMVIAARAAASYASESYGSQSSELVAAWDALLAERQQAQEEVKRLRLDQETDTDTLIGPYREEIRQLTAAWDKVDAERQQAIDALRWIQQFAAKTLEVGVDGVVNPGFTHVERAARAALLSLGEQDG